MRPFAFSRRQRSHCWSSSPKARPDDQALAYLGAGPVEDFLLERHADDVIDQVEVAARRSAGFRSALHCAHYDDVVAPDARDRLRRFGDPY
jgi:hypothetical protein